MSRHKLLQLEDSMGSQILRAQLLAVRCAGGRLGPEAGGALSPSEARLRAAVPALVRCKRERGCRVSVVCLCVDVHG